MKIKQSIIKASKASEQERKIFNSNQNLDYLIPENHSSPEEYIRELCFDLFCYLDEKRELLGDENVPLEDYENLVSDIYDTQQEIFPHKPFLELRDDNLYFIPTHNQPDDLLNDILLALTPLISISTHILRKLLIDNPLPLIELLLHDFNSLLKPDPEAQFKLCNDRLKTLSILYSFSKLNLERREEMLLTNPGSKLDHLMLRSLKLNLKVIENYLEGCGEVIAELDIALCNNNILV